jgi:hypothetical protein
MDTLLLNIQIYTRLYYFGAGLPQSVWLGCGLDYPGSIPGNGGSGHGGVSDHSPPSHDERNGE